MRWRRKDLDLETAQIVLEDGLREYAYIIRGLRSYHQHLQASRSEIDDDLLNLNAWERIDELGRCVKENSNGRVYCGRSGFFSVPTDNFMVVFDNHFAWTHYRSLGLNDVDIIAGFWFLFYNQKPRLTYECMLVDGGRSIQTFEELDKKTKREFVEGFTERRRESLVVVSRNLPTAYCAVMTERDLDEYDIKMILPFKFGDPYVFDRV